MAKRRKLEAPDTAALADLEAGFAAKPVADRMGISAPIAQVAGEIARDAVPLAPQARVAMAGTTAAAENWKQAEQEGRVLTDLPLNAIETDHLVRDRMVLQPGELDELKASIRANGMRLPVEVVTLEAGRYGLISGLRRITVLRQLHAENPTRWATARALIRPSAEAGQTYAAMVEENEQRAQLTPYERGRIAVVAAAQGAFLSVEAAVDAIFAPASKAKRSKIRSFALVHEELGDLLSYPVELSERNGLRLAAALRQGQTAHLREALSAADPGSAEAEIAALDPILRRAEAAARPAEKGGRPRTRPEPEGEPIADGLLLERIRHGDGFSLRFHGKAADPALMERLANEMKRLLG